MGTAAGVKVAPVKQFEITLRGKHSGIIVAQHYVEEDERVDFYRSGRVTASYLSRFVTRIREIHTSSVEPREFG
jgi:hypothetical protein